MLMQESTFFCLCNFCRNWLSFEPAKVGELVNCPYCLMETILYVAERDRPYALSKYPLELRKIAWDVSSLGHRCIVGEIVNRSHADLDWARIEFALYNGIDAVIGAASDCLMKFGAGQKWTFRAPVFDADVVRASMPTLSTEYGRLAPEDRVTIMPAPQKPATPAYGRSNYG